jgi:hypothetical protein
MIEEEARHEFWKRRNIKTTRRDKIRDWWRRKIGINTFEDGLFATGFLGCFLLILGGFIGFFAIIYVLVRLATRI